MKIIATIHDTVSPARPASVPCRIERYNAWALVCRAILFRPSDPPMSLRIYYVLWTNGGGNRLARSQDFRWLDSELRLLATLKLPLEVLYQEHSGLFGEPSLSFT